MPSLLSIQDSTKNLQVLFKLFFCQFIIVRLVGVNVIAIPEQAVNEAIHRPHNEVLRLFTVNDFLAMLSISRLIFPASLPLSMIGAGTSLQSPGWPMIVKPA